MKKCIIVSTIVCTLVSSNTTLSMFKLLRTQHHRPHARMYHTSKTIDSLPEKSIHDSSEAEIAINAGILMEKMYDRNQKLAKLLQEQIGKSQSLLEDVKEQNHTAINYTFNGESLDITELKRREESIREKAKKFYSLNDFNSLFYENKFRGHPNE